VDVAPGAPAASTWLEHLPAVFREAPPDGGEPFLGRFLLAFEHLLTGVGDAAEPGLDERVSGVPTVLDPALAPASFLDWLAGWVALTLRADLDTELEGGGRERARALVADAVSLYRVRGTRQGMVKLVSRLTGAEPTISEPGLPLQLGVTSTLDVDTRVEGGPPHLFHVLLRLATPDATRRARLEALVRAVLDVEKPAHTRYHLDVITPAMQIGVYAQIGVDTLLSPAATPGAEP